MDFSGILERNDFFLGRGFVDGIGFCWNDVYYNSSYLYIIEIFTCYFLKNVRGFWKKR